MICPCCAYENTKVIATIKGTYIDRFRKCPRCKYTFMTTEIIKYDGYIKEYLKDTLNGVKELKK